MMSKYHLKEFSAIFGLCPYGCKVSVCASKGGLAEVDRDNCFVIQI